MPLFIVSCPAGHEETSTGHCHPCGIGYYRDNDKNPFGPCTLCPEKYITSSEYSISEDECTIGN